MLAPARLRIGARWSATDRQPRGRPQLLIDDARKGVGAVEVRRLRELPLDERHLARAAAEDRQHGSVGLRLPARVLADAIEAQRVNDRRRARSAAAIRWRAG